MKYRQLGNQGLRVSELALGSWMTDVSDQSKQELAAQSIREAYDNGINFFDCRMRTAAGRRNASSGRRCMSYRAKNW
ncbi:hypothetical protein [Lacticaseibacillus nasuensis]|uniref:hypothetical protein n=1 Tax=Lacticaseibacillus nasuensis TaxID=944671 RepID=UPI000ACFDD19|nr:hypothetical protein [Lacticaseibacillus nasuensis]